MQPQNRLGLGLRPPVHSYGQGPSISALAAQQQMHHPPSFTPSKPQPTTLFIGSISGGITDTFLNEILKVSVCSMAGPRVDSEGAAGMRPYLFLQTLDYPSK